MLVKFINNPKSLQLDGFRSINSITLGPNWMPGEPRDNFWHSQYSFHYRRGEPAIYLISRTQPLEPADAEWFRDIFISGPHTVMVDEWKNLRAVVADQVDAEQFALKSAEVVDWNGKLVLVTQGKWTALGFRVHNIFIDAQDDGKFVEEVIYQAPAVQYNSLQTEAMISLQSIEFKKMSRW